jgi:putative hemolysin
MLMEALVIIGCLLLSAFFSGMETAYISANKVYLKVESNQSSFVSRILTKLTENPVQFVTAMLVGNSIALVLYVYHMAQLLSCLVVIGAPFWQVIFQVLIAAALLLITADFIPKVFFQVYANQLIKVLALPAYCFYILFYWVSRVLMPVADFVLVRILGANAYVHKAYFTKGELGAYVNQQFTSEEVQDEVDAEVTIFKNALSFGTRKVADIMTPQEEVAGVELDSDLAVLRQLFIDTGYSKIVVYRRTPDNIIGYVHSFALFQSPSDIAGVMVPVVQASGAMFIKDLLRILTRRRRSMAVVLGAGNTAVGIVTVEDIVEELFGEIEDEHDLDVPVVQQKLSENSWLFSARVEVAGVNVAFGLGLPEHASYTTLGGLVVHSAKVNPYKGLQVKAGGFIFTIEEATGQKIELIKVVKITFE